MTVALVGLAVVAILIVSASQNPGVAFGGAYQVDALTTFLDLLFVSIIALTILFAPDYLAPRGLPIAEFAVVLIFAMTGAMLISASTDLLVLFLGLELMVLPGYLLAAFAKRDASPPRARSSTSCSGRSARRSSCSGWRSSGA